MSRLSRGDWLDAGMALLAADGAGALTLERLCAATGRTRGSFYHHFPAGMDAFAQAVIGHWRELHCEKIIRTVGGPDPRAELDRMALELDGAVERAMRLWAETDAGAREAVAAADQRRLDFLAAVIARDAGRSPADARELAAIEYAAYVGATWLFPGADRRWLARLAARLSAMIADA